MSKSPRLYLNEILTSRFRSVVIIFVILIVAAALTLVIRSVGGFIGSIGHSYHQANDMSKDVGTFIPSLRIW